MTGGATAELSDVIDRTGFESWADRHLPDLGGGPLNCRVLAGGASNIVLRIDRGGAPMVLRRPPRVPRPDSAKIIGREAVSCRR